MCPFRVLVILFSLLIALFATMAALAKDPDEEEEEARLNGEKAAPKSLWYHFVDFWTGRYLYRETKRLMPFMFAKDAPPAIVEEEESSSSSDSNVLVEASAPASEQDFLDAAQAELAAQPPVPEPSAPEAEEPHQQKHSPEANSVVDAAFERASLKHRQPRLHEMGIVGAVIS